MWHHFIGQIKYEGFSLMEGVFILHTEMSDSSDSPNKARVVHVVLPIAVTWCGIDESTPETPFFI